MKTMRPSAKEKAELKAFEDEIRERGEFDARLRNIARQGVIDGAADNAKWAALLVGLGGLFFWMRGKKKAESSFAGDPIVKTALDLGMRIR